MEGDFPAQDLSRLPTTHFNPLPPHGGRPLRVSEITDITGIFQSTPSAWRETDFVRSNCCHNVISIHSLRMEGDHRTYRRIRGKKYFNPLPPHGGRHIVFFRGRIQPNFNPLPPHGGRPPCAYPEQYSKIYFNPLPPHGGRRMPTGLFRVVAIFQSTPSAWRETG